jgi:hypothetical protein
MQLVSITTNDVILYPAHVVLDTTLCDEVCQWFSPSTPVSSTNKIYRPDIFERLFAQYFPHFWQLVPTFNPPTDGWRVFKDSAKVRFSCQVCI